MNDWIEWSGGEQPVGNNIEVEMKFRDEWVEKDYADNYVWDWDDSMPEYDIVAYRVVE